jgi:hypothetical protein
MTILDSQQTTQVGDRGAIWISMVQVAVKAENHQLEEDPVIDEISIDLGTLLFVEIAAIEGEELVRREEMLPLIAGEPISYLVYRLSMASLLT